MKHADIKAMMAEIAPVIREFTAASLAPVMDKLSQLEKRLDELPTPKDGKDADPEAVSLLVAEKMAGELAELRAALEVKPKDGESVSNIDVEMIDGGATAVFKFTVGDTDHVFEVPLPSGPAGQKGDAGEAGQDGRDGIDGKDGRNGLDVKDLFRADGGRLVAVMSDGTTKDLGVFVGKDGAPGADGADGVGFDDMTCEVREDGVYLVWEKGEVLKEARLPVPVDMGVYKADTAYKRGACVTWGGSVWIAQKDDPAGKPDAPDSDWRLAVKRGQNGKDAK